MVNDGMVSKFGYSQVNPLDPVLDQNCRAVLAD